MTKNSSRRVVTACHPTLIDLSNTYKIQQGKAIVNPHNNLKQPVREKRREVLNNKHSHKLLITKRRIIIIITCLI